jgi:carboxyl-terminal processing protease
MARIARWWWLPPAALVILAVIFGTGFVLGQRAPVLLAQAASQPSASPPDFNLIHEAWDIIDRVYVDRAALQTDPLTWGAIGGMVDALGDTGHSAFLSPKAVQEERQFIRGQYVGVGLEIQTKDGRVTIVAPLDNSPALRAGLHAGEEIQKVEGASVAGLSLQQVIDRILGPEGTSVTLTIHDPLAARTFDVTLKRQVIRLDNVSWAPVSGRSIADLRLAAFSSGVTREVRAALEEIQRQQFAGLVLDLRNDPGGSLDEAIGVASQFLAGGNVLEEKNAQGAIRADPVQPGGVALTIPMVVLVNAGTASAAEIVAGALQDARRAPIVGETTFGTGTVLEGFRLSDGSELLLAVTEWLTPKGRTIWHSGITPDDPVALAPTGELLTPLELKQSPPPAVDAATDAQLARAVELLAAPARSP